MCASVAAEPGRWTIDYASSRIAFTAEQAEAPFDGSFKTFEADVRFDPAALADSRADVQIDTASVATSDKERDGILQGQRLVRIGTVSPRALRRERVREDERRIRGARRADDPFGDAAGGLSFHAEGRGRAARIARRGRPRSPRVPTGSRRLGRSEVDRQDCARGGDVDRKSLSVKIVKTFPRVVREIPHLDIPAARRHANRRADVAAGRRGSVARTGHPRIPAVPERRRHRDRRRNAAPLFRRPWVCGDSRRHARQWRLRRLVGGRVQRRRNERRGRTDRLARVRNRGATAASA